LGSFRSTIEPHPHEAEKIGKAAHSRWNPYHTSHSSHILGNKSSRDSADHVSFREANWRSAMDLWSLACLIVLTASLLTLSVIDLRTGYLPDPLQAALAIAGAGVIAVGSPVGITWELAILGALINGAVFWALRWIVGRLKGREAMGLGDVKLVAVGGIWLGPFALPYVMAAGGILTLLGVGIASAITRRPKWQGEMPLGPGLAVGILGAYIANLFEFPWLPLTY
jgi:prepilin signal peptidase PulO-like enzyme (type II secretory pathway)